MKRQTKKLDALITKAIRRWGDLADYRVVTKTKWLRRKNQLKKTPEGL